MEKTEASYENRLSVPIPRRRQLLGQMGLEFTTQSPEIDESAFHGRDARDLVETLSREKARWVARQQTPDTLVIGADTVAVSYTHLTLPTIALV